MKNRFDKTRCTYCGLMYLKAYINKNFLCLNCQTKLNNKDHKFDTEYFRNEQKNLELPKEMFNV